jgi:hypothetical protein
MNRNLMLFAIVLAALLVMACEGGPPHKVADEEFDSAFAGKTFSNLLVIGIYEDRTFRISGETTLAEELKVRGVKASPSYDLLPNTRASAAEIQSALRSLEAEPVSTESVVPDQTGLPVSASQRPTYNV